MQPRGGPAPILLQLLPGSLPLRPTLAWIATHWRLCSPLLILTRPSTPTPRRHMISTFEQAIRLMPPPPPPAAAGEQAALPPRPVESWCWVMDFHGFSLRDCDPRLAKVRACGVGAAQGRGVTVQCSMGVAEEALPCAGASPHFSRLAPVPQIFLNLSAAHYPERLGTFFIVSAPAVFNTLWRAISRFIDPVTKQKVGGCEALLGWVPRCV